MTENKKLATLIASALLLTGCSTSPAEDDRAERAALAMHFAHSLDSKLIADGMKERGLYDLIAEDLIEICDQGSSTPYAYIVGFDDSTMETVIMTGWAVACEEDK